MWYFWKRGAASQKQWQLFPMQIHENWHSLPFSLCFSQRKSERSVHANTASSIKQEINMHARTHTHTHTRAQTHTHYSSLPGSPPSRWGPEWRGKQGSLWTRSLFTSCSSRGTRYIAGSHTHFLSFYLPSFFHPWTQVVSKMRMIAQVCFGSRGNMNGHSETRSYSLVPTICFGEINVWLWLFAAESKSKSHSEKDLQSRWLTSFHQWGLVWL